MTAPARPLRRDARRNRERIVAAARELFAEQGIEVPVDEVTRRAGVGMGTLYRHFATKADLVDAVLEDAFAEFVGLAREALATPDAWAAFAGFVERGLELYARNRGLKDVAESRGSGRRRAEEMRVEVRPLIEALVDRAHQRGGLRRDFTPHDVSLLFWGGAGVIEHAPEDEPDAWRRQLAFVLDGLRDRSGA